MFRGVRLAFVVFWSLIGVAVLILFRGNPIFWLLALFAFYRAFLRPLVLAKTQYRTLAKTHGKEDWLRTITFEEDGIIVTEDSTSIQYAYEDVSEIREKGDQIKLVFQNQTAVRLYQSAFVDTDWTTCKAFIQEKRPHREA